jgi:hypothetical protein
MIRGRAGQDAEFTIIAPFRIEEDHAGVPADEVEHIRGTEGSAGNAVEELIDILAVALAESFDGPPQTLETADAVAEVILVASLQGERCYGDSLCLSSSSSGRKNWWSYNLHEASRSVSGRPGAPIDLFCWTPAVSSSRDKTGPRG